MAGRTRKDYWFLITLQRHTGLCAVAMMAKSMGWEESKKVQRLLKHIISSNEFPQAGSKVTLVSSWLKGRRYHIHITFMQQSIVRRTIGPPGMVHHLFNVRRVSMYHDGPQCPNYDGHSSTTTELSVSFVTYHYSILTNHYCPSDGRFIGKYAYACTHCTCILLQKQVQPCWILKLHFLYVAVAG